jgi:hypothetical protein
MITPSSKHARPGSALAIIVVLLVALLGFLGVAIYTGLNAYLQNELQNAASSAAGAGASAFYDRFDPGSGMPQKSPDLAQLSAQQTFNGIVSANPALGNFNTRLINGTPKVNGSNDTVTINSRADVPTPFLAPIGINTYSVDANATARYGYMSLDSSKFTINTKTGPYFRILNLDPPVVDAPGPDLAFNTAVSGGGWHGVIVELCSNGKCYDVGPAAKVYNGQGIAVDRDYPGYGRRRVLYGAFMVDLGASNAAYGYTGNVKKGAAVRVVDDGIHDYIIPGSLERGIELDPAPTVVEKMNISHYAVFCPDETNCVTPPGFQFSQFKL